MSGRTTNENFGAQNTKEINKIINHVKEAEKKSLSYVNLDKNALSIVVTMIVFENNKVNTSPLAHLVPFKEKLDNCNVLDYSIHEGKATPSVLADNYIHLPMPLILQNQVPFRRIYEENIPWKCLQTVKSLWCPN